METIERKQSVGTPTPTGIPTNQDLEFRIGTEIRDIGIPPRPAILTRIESEIHKDEPDFKLLADIIGSDVSLAASVIKVSNSAYFGFGKQVRSVLDALLVLGLKLTVNTIAGISLQKAFPNVPDLEKFWDASARTARVSGWLARRLKGRIRFRPEDAYTFGLFRDCGIPVLMIPFPEYRQILKQAESEKDRLYTAVEDELLSINHAIVGADMAEDWRLPADICAGIRYHHDVSALDGSLATPLPESTAQYIAIAQLAQYLIQQHTDLYQNQEWLKLGVASLRLLEVSMEELAEFEVKAREVVTTTL
jgi:HD-like signal output (HDOD) protein